MIVQDLIDTLATLDPQAIVRIADTSKASEDRDTPFPELESAEPDVDGASIILSI